MVADGKTGISQVWHVKVRVSAWTNMHHGNKWKIVLLHVGFTDHLISAAQIRKIHPAYCNRSWNQNTLILHQWLLSSSEILRVKLMEKRKTNGHNSKYSNGRFIKSDELGKLLIRFFLWEIMRYTFSLSKVTNVARCQLLQEQTKAFWKMACNVMQCVKRSSGDQCFCNFIPAVIHPQITVSGNLDQRRRPYAHYLL